MGLPVFIKMSLFMAAVFISNIVQALTGFAGVMLSIPPTILLYGPDMAKAVINVICWLVCAYLMVKNREYINKKELGRIILFMLIGMAAGIYLYNIVDARILVPVYGLLIVGVALKNLLLKPSGASLPVWVAIPVLLGAGIIHGMFTDYEKGLYNTEFFELLGIGVIPLVIAVYLGNKIHSMINQQMFNRLTYGLLLAAGSMILV